MLYPKLLWHMIVKLKKKPSGDLSLTKRMLYPVRRTHANKVDFGHRCFLKKRDALELDDRLVV